VDITVVTVRHWTMLIGYVVSGAVLCVWAEFILLATNRTEGLVNESRLRDFGRCGYQNRTRISAYAVAIEGLITLLRRQRIRPSGLLL